MFDLVVLIFGQYAVPLGIALLLIVIFRTIIQIASDVDKRLLATLVAFVVTASAMARLAPFIPISGLLMRLGAESPLAFTARTLHVARGGRNQIHHFKPCSDYLEAV